ncbi:MAG: PEP-utilizing enzyme [Desulfobulbus sp.]|nr:PEP-utilizing enzyme [Desulfobulbus sp.]
MVAGIRQWWRGLGTFRQDSAKEISFWRLQALFNNFKRILLLNNAVLEEMAKMERALGGEYIFDRAFLESSVSSIANRVHHVAYSLNALTGNQHIPLYDRYQEIRTLLDDILANNVHALADEAVLPLSAIGWEHEPLVGMDLVCLAELFYHPWVAPVDGFAVTEEGIRALDPLQSWTIGTEGRSSRRLEEARAALLDHLHHLVEEHPSDAVTVVVTEIDADEEPLKEVGCFRLRVDAERREASLIRVEGQGIEPTVVDRLVLAERKPGGTAIEGGCEVELLLHGLEQIVHTIAEEIPAIHSPQVNCALFIHPQPPFVLKGTIQTRPLAGNPFAAVDGLVARVISPENAEDHYLLRRTHPFELLQSLIPERPSGHRFAGGRLASDSSAENGQLGRGSGLIEPGLLKNLAETAMLLERLYGAPLEVRWQLWQDGVCRITRLRPLKFDLDVDDIPGESVEAPILCQGGQTGQSGVGAGPVFHIDETTDPKSFPPGAVAVARVASPNLTPVLQRAAALVTEFGSAAGHLATVARELRLPSIFGLPSALEHLPLGVEVTVDGGETTVYSGIVEEMLRFDSLTMDLTPQDREYRMLRRLLRFIQPLNLVNPEIHEFVPENCRTFHDIIHFCHESAVDELAHFQERRPGLGTLRTRPMALGLPMDIRVLDIGSGIEPDADALPSPAQICSIPFRAFLDGLIDPRAWNTETPSLGMRDILAGMPRSMGLLAAPADTLGANLAIVGSEYLNLSLRMGYHFSVIDAYLGEDMSRNYVYFRFVGGLADPERRGRRARFIGRVLAAMEFKTSIKGDLVIARLKLMEPDILRAALFALGALTAYTRQQDTNMRSEADLESRFATFASHFLPAFYQGSSDEEGEDAVC